jgi:hypothetical protein
LFAYEKEQLALFLRRVYKEAILTIVYDYFKSVKNIDSLLTKEQKESFYTYLADVLSNDYTALAFLENLNSVDREDVEKALFEAFMDGKVEDYIDFTDVIMSRDEFIDKVRINIVSEQVDKYAQIEQLKLIAQQMMQNPQAYANSKFTLEDVTRKLSEISDGETMIELSNHMKSAKVVDEAGISPMDPVNQQVRR